MYKTSMALRSFVEYLEKKIREEGVEGSYYSQSEIEDDVINMI